MLTFLNRLLGRRDALTREEILFRDYVVAGLSNDLVRRLLSIGRWIDAEPGAVLAREREPVAEMVFIASGEVEITVEGKTVGYCDIGSLVGEISLLTDTPATATATAKSPVRYLSFERNALLKLMEREPLIGSAIDRTVRQGMRQKLVSTNEALARLQAAGAPPPEL